MLEEGKDLNVADLPNHGPNQIDKNRGNDCFSHRCEKKQNMYK
jgi:hypothetical protein